MVVDSSVLIAILLGEDDAQSFIQILADTDKIYISAVTLVESAMVIEHKKGESGAKKYDELLTVLSANIIAFDSQQARLARIAWQNYGKGKHPAKLNFGDCCSYAAAKFLDLPLLFKGNDFSQTDIQRVS
ncbi:MAG: type II toxin-antitoxin system VapC family toxin [Methylococcaceae bacterium]|nr:type II toxin-antitoxin system VapC family toxin [Methylococcaceae bacterium]